MAETATPTYPSEDPTSTNAPSGAANLGDAHATATDALPSPETQRKVANHTVLDRHGKEHLFKSLYSGDAARVLVIFVRHFFCGVTLSLSLSLFHHVNVNVYNLAGAAKRRFRVMKRE